MSGSVERLARRFVAMRIVAQAALCLLVVWFANVMGLHRLGGPYGGLAASAGLAIAGLALLVLAHRVVSALPRPDVHDALVRLKRLSPLIVLNLIFLTALAPFVQAASRLPIWSPLTQWLLTAVGHVSEKLVLVLFGAGLVSLATLAAMRLLDRLAEGAPGLRSLGRWTGRSVTALAVLYCGLGMVVAFNGSFDGAPAVAHRTEALAVRGIRSQGGMSWVDVRSWRGNGVERIAIRYERDGLWPYTMGEASRPVMVHARPGFLGLAWIERVTVDMEPQWPELVGLAPSAAAPRRALVEALLKQGRWTDAVAHARAYAGYYPDDQRFVKSVADALRAARQSDAARALEQRPADGPRGRPAG